MEAPFCCPGGLVVFKNAAMAAIDLERWCGDAAVACEGFVYGDQDLLNLIIGRQDIEVTYLHPRFNVQLAYPFRQRDAYMDQDWCGYGQATFAAAAAGKAAFGVASFGHFIWLPKPWGHAIDKDLNAIYGVLEKGGRLGIRFSVVSTPPWVNAYRDFALDLLGPEPYEALFGLKPHRRVIDFTILLDRKDAGNIYKCIGANEPILEKKGDQLVARNVTSCAVARPELDSPYPPLYASWDKIQADVKKIPRVDKGEPPDPEAERIRNHIHHDPIVKLPPGAQAREPPPDPAAVRRRLRSRTQDPYWAWRRGPPGPAPVFGA